MHEIKSENDPSSLICFVANMVQIHENQCFKISLHQYFLSLSFAKKITKSLALFSTSIDKKTELSSSLQGLMI